MVEVAVAGADALEGFMFIGGGEDLVRLLLVQLVGTWRDAETARRS